MHHCIQGWSGIAEWGGLPISKIIELVKPNATATTVVFYSFGEGLYGGIYYDTNTIDNCLKPQSILAWEMNYETLPLVHGTPLRLRVENQLGYKMVKWISSIEFLETYKGLAKVRVAKMKMMNTLTYWQILSYRYRRKYQRINFLIPF
jgi:methionine sulfoxide reductase catalytic subunit